MCFRKILFLAPMFSAICFRSEAAPAPDGPSLQLDFESRLNSGGVAPASTRGVGEFVNGKTGQAVRTGGKGSYLLYRAKDVLDGGTGTVGFWIRPQWDTTSPFHHTLWNLHALGTFRLYKQAGGKDIVLLYRGKGQADRQYTVLTAPMSGWKPGEWHHIGVTWQPGEVRLYVDGLLARQSVNPELVLPEVDENSVFALGDCYHPGFPLWKDMSGLADTDFDDFKLYRRALVPQEMSSLAGREAVELTAPALPRIVVPKAKRAPIIDGEFSFDEWRDASGFTGFIDLQTGKVAERQTGMLLTYDDKNLYIASFAPVPEGTTLKSSNDRRDGPSYGDDSIEIHLDPSGRGEGGEDFQFVGNPGGAILDARNGDTGWTGDWKFRPALQGNWRSFGQTYWVTELSIPFTELGRTVPTDGEQWRGNFARSWYGGKQTFTSWCWVDKIRYGAPERFGIIEFRENAPAFQWIGLRDLVSGRAALEGYQSGKQEAKLSLSAAQQAPVTASLRTDERVGQLWNQSVDLSGEGRLVVESKAGNLELYRAELPYHVEARDLRVFLSPVPSQGKLVVDVDPVKFRGRWGDGWKSSVSLVDGAKTLETAVVSDYKGGLMRTVFGMEKLPAGDYKVQVQLTNGEGKVLASETAPFRKPPVPVWFGNKIGVTDAVLKPWTPLVDSGTKLAMWGREYEFGKEAWPVQVSSQGQELLRAPVSLFINGKRAVGVSEAAVEVTGAKNVKAGVARSGNWAVDWTRRAEFDGMLWYEVKVQPGSTGEKLQTMELELPLSAAASTLYHVSNGNFALGGGEAGPTPDKWENGWKQLVWLGNEKAGLCWFAESDENWSLDNAKRAITISKGEQGGTVKIRFVSKAPRDGAPLTFRFGLQATPTRPMPVGWRGWRWAGSGALEPAVKKVQANTHAYSWWQAWSPYISSPLDIKPGAAKVVDSYHDAGMKVIPYQSLTTLNEKAPDFDYFKAEWLHQPQMNGGGEAGQQTWFVNVKGSFQDYFLYSLREMVRGQKWDGIYFDFAQGAVPDQNEFHGSGYVNSEGMRRPTYDLLAQREFMKRLWAMLQQELGVDDPVIMVHNSACLVPPVHSFTNVYFDGEQFRFAPKVNDDYTAVLPREVFRAEFLGQNFGGVPMFLPELNHLQSDWLKAKDAVVKAEARKRFDAAIDTMLLYPLLHGTNFVPAWLDTEYLEPYFEARRTFGLGDAKFLGYWEGSDALKLGAHKQDIVGSLYAREDRLWLILGNWGSKSEDVFVDLKLDQLSPKLDLRNATAKSIWKDGTLEREGNGWRVGVPAKAVRIVEFANP